MENVISEMKREIGAIKGENEVIKSENKAIKSENKAICEDNSKLRELLDGHNKRLVILEGDLATSDNSNKDITKIPKVNREIFTNISSYNQGEANINVRLG